jgi:hypothetical protein
VHRVTGKPAAFASTVAWLIAAGAAVGFLWWVLAPTVPGRSVGAGIAPFETQPAGFVAAEAHYMLWMLLFGAVSAIVVRRRARESSVLALLALLLGTLGGAAAAATVGYVLGPDASAALTVGTLVDAPLRVRSPGALLLAPIAGVGLWFLMDFAAAWRASGEADAEPDTDIDPGRDDAATGGQPEQSLPSTPV